MNRPRTSSASVRSIRPGTPGVLKGHHMARALVGYVGTNNDRILALEITRLRRRVAELESELGELRETSRAEFDLH
jgi:hypothetical protein